MYPELWYKGQKRRRLAARIQTYLLTSSDYDNSLHPIQHHTPRHVIRNDNNAIPHIRAVQRRQAFAFTLVPLFDGAMVA